MLAPPRDLCSNFAADTGAAHIASHSNPETAETSALTGSSRRPLSILSAMDTESDMSPTAAASPRWLKRLSNQPLSSRRSSKPLSAHKNLHPVLKLGYKPMCEVHCNGLQGVFLGGHDRDLFIQCTSPEYRDLPLVDANQGGCIMSCSNFEKVAGRELSKKWKESIHVVGEGEGSKATLLAWLKRQAENMSPDIIGSSVWVCWCNEPEFYLGQILSFNKENGKHKVDAVLALVRTGS